MLLSKSLRGQRRCVVGIRVSKTFNLLAAGLSEDAKDQEGSYIGASVSDGSQAYYSNDPYTIREVGFPWIYEDIEKAVCGFYAPEDNGIWGGYQNMPNWRDEQIEASGLKIVYQVPYF